MKGIHELCTIFVTSKVKLFQNKKFKKKRIKVKGELWSTRGKVALALV